MRKKFFVRGMLFLSVPLLCALPAFAQSSNETGKLKIHVNPKQAYVFVDGKAIRDGSQTIDLAAGNHTVGVFNYGYSPKTQAVQINAGQTTALDVSLQSSGDKVAGPFADLEFKGDPRAAVLLNGKAFLRRLCRLQLKWRARELAPTRTGACCRRSAGTCAC